MIRFLLLLAFLVLPLSAAPETPEAIGKEIIAPLLDPAKGDNLKGDRPANARLYEVLYWLETARRNSGLKARKSGGVVLEVINAAQAVGGYSNTMLEMADRAAIVWARAALDSYGCFTPEGMEKLRNGRSPLVTSGEHAGTSIAMDHVLPLAVVPELEGRVFNLEAIPAKVKLMRGGKITEREIAFARKWHKWGLLSEAGLAAVEAAKAEK